MVFFPGNPSIPSSNRDNSQSKRPCSSASTAAKANQVGLAKLQIQAIDENWDKSSFEDLAEQIIAAEDQVKTLGGMKGAEGLNRAVQKLRFQFVFPLARELKPFGDEIQKVATRVMQNESFQDLQGALNQRQLQEIARFTTREGA